MKKPIPQFETDEEAERFVETADLAEFDFSEFRAPDFEFASKDARITMRVPESLLLAVKQKARSEGMPYQRFIRRALERALGEPTRRS